jgi:hypothetical protein
MDRSTFLTGMATAALSANGRCADGPLDIAADCDREPDGSAEHEPKHDVPTSTPFRIGVESVLPGEGWWALQNARARCRTSFRLNH